jgi:hypothetical protein
MLKKIRVTLSIQNANNVAEGLVPPTSVKPALKSSR